MSSLKEKSSISLLASVLLVFAAQADMFQSVADRDNTIFSESGSESNGAGQNVFAGTTGAMNNFAVRRALLHFGVTAIPPGSTIVSAALRLHLEFAPAGGRAVPMSLHRATLDWGEGTSSDFFGEGANATRNDATWISNFFLVSRWAIAGGDFDSLASATLQVTPGVGFKTWAFAPGLVSDVQGWVNDSSSNFGWFLIGAGGNQTARPFASRENGTPANRPLLIVEFTLPTPDPDPDPDPDPEPEPEPDVPDGILNVIIQQLLLDQE